MSVVGVAGIVQRLKEIPKELRRGVMRNALAAGGRVIRDDARQAAPVLAAVKVRKSGQVVRKPGTLRKAIVVRTSKRSRAEGNVGVFVNIKPAPGAKFKTRRTKVLGITRKQRVMVRKSTRGADNPNDPFYWRFQEFKTVKGGDVGFLRGAVSKFPQALAAVERALARAVARMNKKKGGG
jgi:HK97 gp10 family phage protein